MASIACTYTYKPTIDGTEIKNSTECAENRNTFIVVPQATTSSELATCGTTITIKYKLKNPPPGGVNITSAILDFNYNITAQGRIGISNYNDSTIFPAASGASAGTYSYTIPTIESRTSGTLTITFWPDTINSTIVISYVSLRIYYQGNIIDESIAAPQEVQVYPSYYNRVAVRWQPPNGVTNIDHYSVGLFGGGHNPATLTAMTSELVSDGWIDTQDNTYSIFVPLAEGVLDKAHPETSPAIFAQVCAVTTDNLVGATGTSLLSTNNRYCEYETDLDSLEDENENMFTISAFSIAYRHCSNQIAFMNYFDDTNPLMPLFRDTTNDRISQYYYEELAKQVGLGSNIISDDMKVLTPMTQAQWKVIYERV